MEWVAGLSWNRWPICRGMAGRFPMESVAGMAWNTQSPAPGSGVLCGASLSPPPAVLEKSCPDVSFVAGLLIDKFV